MLVCVHTFVILHRDISIERERECVCVMIVNVSTCHDVCKMFNYKGPGAVYGWSANPEDCASWAVQEVLLPRSDGVQEASPCNLGWQWNMPLDFSGRCHENGRCSIAMLNYLDGIIGSHSQCMLGRTKQQRSLQRSRTAESLEHAQQIPMFTMSLEVCALWPWPRTAFANLPFKSSQSCVVFCQYVSPNKCHYLNSNLTWNPQKTKTENLFMSR